MPSEPKKPGERNEYRLEYRPIRPYKFPPPAEDPPPIVRDRAEIPPNQPRKTSQTVGISPPVSQPVDTRPSTPRRRRRVTRPSAVTVGLVLMFMLLGGCGSSFTLIFWINASFVAQLMGMNMTVSGLIVSLGIMWGLAWFVVWYLGWLFDDITEYRVQVVQEGTARALAELD